MKQLDKFLSQAFQAFDDGQLDEAERLYRECLTLSDGDLADEMRSLDGLGFTLALKERFAESLVCYKRVLEIAQIEQNVSDEAIALHQIAMVYRMEKDFGRALKVFTQEKNLRENLLPVDFAGFSANAYEFGVIALAENRVSESGRYFDEALLHGQKAQDMMCVGCAQRGRGHYFKAIEKIKDAADAFSKSISAFEKVGEVKGAEEVRLMRRELCR